MIKSLCHDYIYCILHLKLTLVVLSQWILTTYIVLYYQLSPNEVDHDSRTASQTLCQQETGALNVLGIY